VEKYVVMKKIKHCLNFWIKAILLGSISVKKANNLIFKTISYFAMFRSGSVFKHSYFAEAGSPQIRGKTIRIYSMFNKESPFPCNIDGVPLHL